MTTEGDIDDKLGPLMDEFLSRKRKGEYPSLSEFVQRHPELETEIRELFPAVAMMEQAEVSEPSHAFAAPVTSDGKELKRLGDFQIIREIGRGGMGVVYEAVQESLGRHVALKLLPWQSVADTRQVQRFQREARIAASLHHSNIVPVYGVGEADGLHFLAMQYIHGQSLDSVLRELQQLRLLQSGGQRGNASAESPVLHDSSGGLIEGAPSLNGVAQSRVIANSLLQRDSTKDRAAALSSSPKERINDSPASERNYEYPPTEAPSTEVSSASLLRSESQSSSGHHYYRRAAELIAQVADALEYAHAQGVLHRDIKPANLMLDVEGSIWITDFGLARAGNAIGSHDTNTADQRENLTQTGDLIGTLRYLAPERFQGDNDYRSDVYSLGLTLFEFLTLQPAFHAADRVTLIRLITTSPTPLPRTVVPDIPRDLETIVTKAAHPDARLRYQSAAEMAKDLRRFLDDKPIVARRASSWKRFQLWCRRNPSVAVLSGLALTLLMLVTIVSSVAAVKLSNRQDELLFSLDRANNAEARERQASLRATKNLFVSYAAAAKSGREGFRPGRAFDGLDAIAKASALRERLNIDAEQVMRLRNEAIACMGLVDVELDVDRPDPGLHASFVRWGFDSRLQQYARVTASGEITVLGVADGTPTACLSRGWSELYPPRTRFSPDDRFLAVMGYHDSGTCRLEIWDLKDQTLYLPGVPSSVDWHADAVAFNDDGRHIAWIGDRQLIVFDLQQRQVVHRRMLDYSPEFVVFCPSGCHLAIGWGQAVAVCDWRSDHSLTVIPHPAFVRAASFSHSGRFLATACFDARARVWDLQQPEHPVSVCEGHTSKLLSAEFSPDDRVLVTTAWDDTSRIWNPWSGRQLLRINRYASGFSKGGEWLALQETGLAVGRYRIATGEACKVLNWRQPGIGVYGIAFHQNGRLLAHSAGHKLVIREWPTGQVLHEFGAPGRVVNVEFSGSGELLYACCEGGFVRWDARGLLSAETLEIEATRQEITGTPGTRMHFSASADSAVGFLFAAGGSLFECDAAAHELAMGASLPSEPNDCFVETTFDGRLYAIGGKHTNVVKVFQSTDHSEVYRYEFPQEQSAQIVFAPTGRQLLLSSRGKLLVFDTTTWEIITEVKLNNTGYVPAVYSPDSTLLAVHDVEEIVLIRTEDWQPLARFQNPYGESYSKAGPEAALGLKFSPDQRYLASGTSSDQQCLYVWDLHEVRQKLAAMNLDWDAPPVHVVPPAESDSVGISAQCFCHLPVGEAEMQTEKRRRLEVLLADDPDNVELLKQHASLLVDAKMTAEAIFDYDRILTSRPDDVHVRSQRAWLLLTLYRNREAARDFERVLELSQQDNERWSWASHSLAWLLLIGEPELRDDDRAIELMEEAFRRTPDDTLVANTYGLALCRAGRFDDAVPVLIANLKRKDNTSAATDYLCLAWAWHAQGDSQASTEAWNAAMRTWFAVEESKLLNVIEFQRLSREVATKMGP